MTREEAEAIGRRIEAYAAALEPHQRSLPAEPVWEEGGDVPPEMRVGEVDHWGWVEWRVMPSAVTPADVDALEEEIGHTLPPSFRAYLMARAHLLDFGTRRFNNQLLLFGLPTRDPLGGLRDLLGECPAFLRAGLIPFGDFGDGWGPLCFDTHRRGPDGECPILWLDHEDLARLEP